MGSRPLRISLALLWFVWTGVIIPGHTRGMIPVPGSAACGCGEGEADAPGVRGCAGEPDAETSRDKKQRPRNSQNCAVCHLAAKVSRGTFLPPALPRLDLVSASPVQAPEQLVSAPAVLPRQCRDPPSA